LRGVFFYPMNTYNNFINLFESAISNANRDISEVELIAVSKKKSSDEIKKVINLGQLSFGENQIQEVENKWIALKKEFPKIKLHFIGGIQSRKVRSIFEHCDVIHSLDRIKIAELFSQLEIKTQVIKNYFIQINIGDEDQKGGVRLSDADNFITNCIEKYNLKIIGLMCLPPINSDPKKYFVKLKDIANKHNLSSLSMGMSGDYEMAIECGSTHIRIGTQIFGPRN
jgi:pyridoxal phosphate enzyme (YggS family)